MLRDPENRTPVAAIIATGSEVGLAMAAAEMLADEDIPVRVVSMPNPGQFLAQDAEYRESVLPAKLTARVAVEAGVSHYWHPFTGPAGRIIGMDTFGASAPAKDLFPHFGFTAEKVAEAVRETLG